MYRPMQIIINFETSEELESFMHDMNDVASIKSKMDDISNKLRNLIKHCDMPEYIADELQQLRNDCYQE